MAQTAVSRTGTRLRLLALSRLQQFRTSYDEPMFRAQTVLAELGLDATSRLKTTNTIIEAKLKRRSTMTVLEALATLESATLECKRRDIKSVCNEKNWCVINPDCSDDHVAGLDFPDTN